MNGNRIRRSALTILVGTFALLPATPAHALMQGSRITGDDRPGPCALAKVDGEGIQDFSIRLITCAVDRWPVPGGADEAICIARRESGLIPSASSPSGRYLGLYQHGAEVWGDHYLAWTRPVWELKPNALNGRTNAIVTIRMVNAEGWGAWAGVGCSSAGSPAAVRPAGARLGP